MKMEKMMEKFRLVAAATLAVALLGQVDSVYGSAPTGGEGAAPEPKPEFDPCIEACVTHYANKKVGNPAFKGDFIYDFVGEKRREWTPEEVLERSISLSDRNKDRSKVYGWAKWISEQLLIGVNSVVTTVSTADMQPFIENNFSSCHESCIAQFDSFSRATFRATLEERKKSAATQGAASPMTEPAMPVPGAGREEAAAPAPLAVPSTPGSVPPPPPPLPKVSPGEGNVAGSSGGGGGGAPPPPSTGEEPRQVDTAITEKLRSDLEAHRAARAKKDEEASSSDSSEFDF